jgi:magnesium-transporting ATPase (P-type)
VALTDANINQWVPIAGLAVFLAVQIFGIIGAALRNKVMVIIYALLESVAFLLLLGVLIIFAIYLYGCNPEAPLYGPELCELFTDRTTTINNLILVCFVVVIGVFAIIYSWRMFLHLHRKSKCRFKQTVPDTSY